MQIFTRPILEINLNNLLSNFQTLRQIAHPAIPAAVIKDNAYGLDAMVVARLLYDKAAVRHFFTAHASEAQPIAQMLGDVTIYVLQGCGSDSLELFRQTPQLRPVICSPDMLEFWRSSPLASSPAAIQIETGLNRLGFREDELSRLSTNDLRRFSLVISHLACGDEKDHFMNEHQLNIFQRLKAEYFPETPASLAASDGVFLGGDFRQNMVRLGAAMYGINTAPYRPNQMQNVVSVKAPVLQTARLPKGDFVGYSATYRAADERSIAIVSIGYGDGIPRSLSNTGKVFFPTASGLFEARIIGRVSMDNIICDITAVPDIKVGNYAVLADDFYTLDDMARDAGTISYEIMSRLGKNPRFDRRYKY